MRFLLHITMPHEEFNDAVKDGSAGEKIQKILDDCKPEMAYFTEQNGKRCGILVVNMDDVSQVPSLAEPWFLTFNADVEFRVAMTPADLEKASLTALGQKWS